ncbi:MAG: lysophospholipid acyltransferase family protein, partial [Chloroflexota bacterium]
QKACLFLRKCHKIGPMFLQLLIRLARRLLRIIASVDVNNIDNLPPEGSYIIATNHLGRLDAILGILLAERSDTAVLIADKYRQYWFWRWAVRRIDGIWIKRNEADFRALRQVQKRLEAGYVVGIAPEGQRSPTATLMEGKQGVAFLASKAGVPVVPVAVIGTEDAVVRQRLRRFQRLQIKIWVGRPFMLPPLPRKEREAFLKTQTDEVMCQIAALLPEDYRGFYADHPKLQALVAD